MTAHQKEQTPTESRLRTAGQFPLAVFQNFRSSVSLKQKTPLGFRVGWNWNALFLLNSLPTRPASSLDWVSVRSCRDNHAHRRTFPTGR